MIIKNYLPSTRLQPFIKAFMLIESKEGMQNRILPDASIIMAFSLQGRIKYTDNAAATTIPATAITGLKRSFRVVTYPANGSVLLVKFTEAGATAFFDVPLHEFFNETIAADAFIKQSTIDIVHEQLAKANDDPSRIAVIEQFLKSQYKERQSDKLVHAALQQIVHNQGSIRIQELLSSLDISQDPFEKRFRKVVGASPKRYAEIVRLRSLIAHQPKASSLTDLALSFGYFDQAHFIKSFKSFTGQSPKQFFQSEFW